MKLEIVIGVVCFLAGALIRPTPVAEERIITVTKEVVKIEKVEAKKDIVKTADPIKRTKEIKQPDGTIIKETEEIGKTVEKQAERSEVVKKDEEKSSQKTVEISSPQWSLGVKLDPFKPTILELDISRRVIGNLFLTSSLSGDITQVQLPQVKLGVMVLF